MQNVQALLLNADYRPKSFFPLSTISWQEAVKLVHEDLATVVANYDIEIHSPSVTMFVPSVVALHRYVHLPHHVPFTRFNVFLRDHFRCQYCGNKFAARELTFDHVVPRCDGGETSWDNIVACCLDCNSQKDNQRQVPRIAPRKPSATELFKAQMQFPPNYLHDTWLDYLYWTAELEP